MSFSVDAVAHRSAVAPGSRATARVSTTEMPKSSTIPRTVASAYAKVNLPNSAGPRTRAVAMTRTRDPNRVAWPRTLSAALRATRSALPGGRRSCRGRPVDRQGLARRALPGELRPRGRGRPRAAARAAPGRRGARPSASASGSGAGSTRSAAPAGHLGQGARGSRRRRAPRPPSPRGPAARIPPTATETRRRGRPRRGRAGRHPARRRRSAPRHRARARWRAPRPGPGPSRARPRPRARSRPTRRARRSAGDRGEKDLEVLLRLEVADEQHVRAGEAVARSHGGERGRPAGHEVRRGGLGHDHDALGRQPIAGQDLAPRRLRDRDDAVGPAEGAAQETPRRPTGAGPARGRAGEAAPGRGPSSRASTARGRAARIPSRRGRRRPGGAGDPAARARGTRPAAGATAGTGPRRPGRAGPGGRST